MVFQLFLATLLAKSISILIKNLNLGGGSAAPGYYALKIYPNLLSDLTPSLPKAIVITGTNGKTTTSRMLSHMAQAQSLKILRNQTGSNLERGIVSAILTSYSISEILAKNFKLKFDLSIWELDEAAFAQFGDKLEPDIIVFLNVFRDQLDRYGEVDTIVKRWSQALKKINKDTVVLINNDDHSLLDLKKSFSGQIQSFGIKDQKITGEKIVKTNGKADFEAFKIKSSSLDHVDFGVRFLNQDYPVTIPIPGIYHIYDFLASLSCAYHLGFPMASSIQSVKAFSPAFGRVEKIRFEGLEGLKMGYIFLIKNPTGATEVFKTIQAHINPSDRLLLALNDNLADGTDVSWIWDAQFEILAKPKIDQVIVSGSRAYDLALRLKYAGLDSNITIVEPNLHKALTLAKDKLQDKLIILPTYTALLELQKILVKEKIKGNYWKEQR